MTSTKIFNLQYTICLWKAYFEKGYGITSYAKYLLFLIGMNEVMQKNSMKLILIAGVIYLTSCFFIGWFWYKTNFIRAEAEVGNRFNYFQEEVRNKLINTTTEKFK